MKHLKKFEGFLYDNSGVYVGSPPPDTDKLALELIDPLLEPIRDFYELECVGLSHNKLQIYFNFKDEDGKDVKIDPRLFKLLKALSAKLKDYGLKVMIEKPSIAKLFSNSVDIDVDELSKDKIYQTGYLLIRDDRYDIKKEKQYLKDIENRR